MRTVREDIENINKFLDALYHARNCITDMQTRIDNHAFGTNKEILEEIGIAHDFLTDAEKYLKITMECTPRGLLSEDEEENREEIEVDYEIEK